MSLLSVFPIKVPEDEKLRYIISTWYYLRDIVLIQNSESHFVDGWFCFKAICVRWLVMSICCDYAYDCIVKTGRKRYNGESCDEFFNNVISSWKLLFYEIGKSGFEEVGLVESYKAKINRNTLFNVCSACFYYWYKQWGWNA